MDRDFVFFGHSLGGLIAFELARKLQAANESQPEHLFVAAFRAPHLPSIHPPMHGLPENEFIAALMEMEGIPEPLLQNREMLVLIANIARSDFKLHETYAYPQGPKLNVPITVFGGDGDPYIQPDMLRAWAQETTRNFNFHWLPGNHHFIHDQKNIIVKTIFQSIQISR